MATPRALVNPNSAGALSAIVGKLVREWATFDSLKSSLFFYVLATNLLKAYRHVLARGLIATLNEGRVAVATFVVGLVLRTPSMRRKVDSEMAKARADIEAKLVPSGAAVTRHLSLPATGRDPAWIKAEMDNMDVEGHAPGDGERTDWRDGKLSGAVYHGGEDIAVVINAAVEKYVVSNPLHPDVFPAIRKMDSEIVAMCLRLYNNPNGAGTTTSGGTESIIMAVKTHKDWAKATKGVTEPEMIVPVSAHAAFDKAANYFKIKIHKIPVDPVTRQVDLRRVRRAINPNTIMLVGSAINFPDGCQDDITALGKLAKRANIGLHVDCCLGSFIMPFLEEAGFPVQPFDFRVAGVTSISCDTHKYGFAPKGSSVIMYRDAELRRYQYFVMTDWNGGVYASPTIAGSRPGSILAGTWAAMQYMGHNGYLESCRSIVSCAKKIEHAIRTEIPELAILGSPPASVVAFQSSPTSSSQVNVHEVGDAMAKKGWHLNALANPPGVHIACTRLTVPHAEQFIADLKDSVALAKASPSGKGTMVMIYGLGSSSAAGPGLVKRLAEAFVDTMYKA